MFREVSNQNNHQVVEHHLVKGQHVATLGDGTLGGDHFKTDEFLARASLPEKVRPLGERGCARAH